MTLLANISLAYVVHCAVALPVAAVWASPLQVPAQYLEQSTLLSIGEAL
jgi:hypothetical protein